MDTLVIVVKGKPTVKQEDLEQTNKDVPNILVVSLHHLGLIINPCIYLNIQFLWNYQLTQAARMILTRYIEFVRFSYLFSIVIVVVKFYDDKHLKIRVQVNCM